MMSVEGVSLHIYGCRWYWEGLPLFSSVVGAARARFPSECIELRLRCRSYRCRFRLHQFQYPKPLSISLLKAYDHDLRDRSIRGRSAQADVSQLVAGDDTGLDRAVDWPAHSVGMAFGPFRHLSRSRGRALITSEHERKAKYLLNQAYVPANFDALIIAHRHRSIGIQTISLDIASTTNRLRGRR